MATFVPYASCYGNKQAVQLLGRNSYFNLFASPPCLMGQRQRLACQAPEMTLRQITHLIRALRQLNLRDAKAKPLPDSPRSRSSTSSTESQHSRTRTSTACPASTRDATLARLALDEANQRDLHIASVPSFPLSFTSLPKINIGEAKFRVAHQNKKTCYFPQSLKT